MNKNKENSFNTGKKRRRFKLLKLIALYEVLAWTFTFSFIGIDKLCVYFINKGYAQDFLMGIHLRCWDFLEWNLWFNLAGLGLAFVFILSGRRLVKYITLWSR